MTKDEAKIEHKKEKKKKKKGWRRMRGKNRTER
jgi:hypothetical protein